MYVVGEKGTILRTRDRGATWDLLTSGTTATIWDVWGPDERNVYAVGGTVHVFDGDPPNASLILRSADDGASWEPQANGAPGDFGGVWGTGPNDVFVSGHGGELLHSTDGRTWAPLASGTSYGLGHIWGTGTGDIYAIGGLDGIGTILRSTDQGNTWSPELTGSCGLDDIWGSSNDDVYVVCDQGFWRGRRP